MSHTKSSRLLPDVSFDTNPVIVTAAIVGYEEQKRLEAVYRFSSKISELKTLLSGSPARAAATPEAPTPKRRITEEGMKRIIAATKKRWRLARAAKAQSTPAKKEKRP